MIALVLDAILVAVPVEAVALAAFHARTGRGLPPGAFLANLAAGFCLLLAARFAVPAGSATFPPAIALALTLALVAHVVDLASRWRSRAAG